MQGVAAEKGPAPEDDQQREGAADDPRKAKAALLPRVIHREKKAVPRAQITNVHAAPCQKPPSSMVTSRFT